MRYGSILFASILGWILFLQGPAAAGPAGDWQVADGSATVRIRKCGSGYCGSVLSTRSPPGRDYKNPDPAKRRRSVIGIEVLSNLRPAGASTWTGTSYNAEDGQTYAARITLRDEQTLQLQGCVPNGGICGSETWTRVR